MAGMMDTFIPAQNALASSNQNFGDARQYAQQGDYAPAVGAAIAGLGRGLQTGILGVGGLGAAPIVGTANVLGDIYRGMTSRPGQMAAPAPVPDQAAPVAHVQVPIAAPQQGPVPGMLVNQPHAAAPAPVAPAAANLRDVVAAFPGARWGDIASLASAAHAASQADTPMDQIQRTLYGLAAGTYRGNIDPVTKQSYSAGQMTSAAAARQALEAIVAHNYTGMYEMGNRNPGQ